MNEDGDIIETLPIWQWRGIELYDFGGLWGLLWGKFRAQWYDPRERDNWKLDCTLTRELWQIGVGPLVLCCMWDESG